MDLSESASIARQARAHVDVAMVAEEVHRSFGGEVPRERVEQLLQELLLEVEFRSARIFAYMPIFLQRAARERLCAELLEPPRH
jgi:hypothetical protein